MPADNTPQAPQGERIAKVMARAGVCSRRQAEVLIDEGHVSVNGQTITTPATFVSESDTISVNGNPISREVEKVRLFRFHKPRGVLSTTDDPQGRPIIYDFIPHKVGRLIHIGRLDMNTEGLLLFTNNSKLADTMMKPSSSLPRTYKVRVDGTLDKAALEAIRNGLSVEGVHYKPAHIEEVPLPKAKQKNSRNQWYQLTLTEGKNREIRNIMGAYGLNVSRLIRTAYGPFVLGEMPEKAFAEVPHNKLEKFLKSLGGWRG